MRITQDFTRLHGKHSTLVKTYSVFRGFGRVDYSTAPFANSVSLATSSARQAGVSDDMPPLPNAKQTKKQVSRNGMSQCAHQQHRKVRISCD
jgi:hypothetical protein